MDVTPLIPQGRQIIQSYANGQFRISGEIYSGAVIVFPERVLSWNVRENLQNFTVEHFEPLTRSSLDARITLSPGERVRGEAERVREEVHAQREGERIDVILFGTGARQIFLKPELKKSLKDQGLFIETMDTGAACRTFNVLMAEGRRAAAALLPV